MFSSNSNISISAALRLCLPVVALAKTGASLLFASPLPGATPPPNVILIITDDQGYGDLAAHGNPVLKTPHMDRLHAESARFTDFHAAPMCSPTRGQLMTGIDAMRNGCTAVCQGRSMMRRELPTMADFFAGSGYATGHFGKWHLGDSYPHRPQDRGFQETIHHRAWGITSLADHWQNTYFDPVLSRNGVDKKFEGYCTDIFFGEAMKWIGRQHAAGKPFFLYLATNTPHWPDVCDKRYSAPYIGRHEGKPIPDKFYGMIANLDENLGKLEAFLDEKGLRDNTLFIFLTDNGTQSSEAQAIFNAGMRDKKTSVYEGGHRVPCFVRWPAGKLKHGTDIDELTQVQDLLPTLIELCGLDTTGKPTGFDGASLAGLIRGTATNLPDRKLVIQYGPSGQPWNPAVVLWKKWRLVGGRELYHVGDDPGQQQNVAASHPEIVKAMSDHYDSWYAEARPLFDRPRWITIGSVPEPSSILYAQDWTGGFCDNGGGLNRATATGYWNVIVDRAGVYQVELRRWPRESEKTLTEGRDGPDDTGPSARPIAAANLQIAGANYTLDVEPRATHVTFRVRLPAGKTRLATHFLDSQDRTLCSAIYTCVEWLPDQDAALTPSSSREPKPSARQQGRPSQ
ncbi:arylsulfatase [Haloferula sp. A504]|uniref:arylsulfatase n=1 Tax=Haloferula sp. A504 TaxID=3373601 RepID=UPI0031CB20BE|nr:arylsulfatase [Verrucomicrobiaceae bacterium E54]